MNARQAYYTAIQARAATGLELDRPGFRASVRDHPQYARGRAGAHFALTSALAQIQVCAEAGGDRCNIEPRVRADPIRLAHAAYAVGVAEALGDELIILGFGIKFPGPLTNRRGICFPVGVIW